MNVFQTNWTKKMIAFLALAAFVNGASAATANWAGGAAGDWAVETNWDLGALPAGGDLVEISSGTVRINEGDETASGEIRIGNTGDGTLEVTGGAHTMTSGLFNIGHTQGFSGTFRMSGGTFTLSVQKDQVTRVGRHGAGLFEMTGGTFTTASDFLVPAYADATGTMRVLGGSVTQTYGWINVGYSDNSFGTFEVGNGGTVTLAGDNARLYLGRGAGAHGDGFLRTGGTLEVTHVVGADASTFTFDGGTLKAHASAPVADPFLAVPTTITANGAVIDTQAFDAYVGIALNGAGGLTKLGTGSLTLAGANTYQGPTLVSAGTLVVPRATALPGFDQAGQITVADGARLVLGAEWTSEEIALLKANVNYLGEGEFTVGVEFDTTSGDLVLADDLDLVDGFNKVGPNMLKLTGHNTFGAAPIVKDGTLQADFGQGLDATQGVVLQGGTLSSDSGTLVATFGDGPGLIALRGTAAGFTARGTPLAVNCAEGTCTFGSDLFPISTFILNGADADATVIWSAPLELNGTESNLRTDAATAVVAGPVVDTPLTGKLHKTGNGTMVFRNDFNHNRVYLDDGDVLFTNHTFTAIYLKANAGPDHRVDIADATIRCAGGDGFNISNDSRVYLHETGVMELNNFNAPAGDFTAEPGAALNVTDQFYGAKGVFNLDGATFALGGGDGKFRIGNGNGSDYHFRVNDGRASSGGTVSVGYSGGTGTVHQAGGMFTTDTYLFFGHKTDSWGYGDFRGGQMSLPSTDTGTFAAGYDGNGFVTVDGTADIDVNYLTWIGRNNNVQSGVIRLNGGRLSTPQVRGTDKRDGDRIAGGANRALIFNGGTLRAKPMAGRGKYVLNDGGFIRELTHLWVTENGGTLDTDGNDISLTQPITCDALPIHRWSFTDGSLVDEITGREGTVTGFSSHDDNEQITLSGGASGQSVIDLGANMIPAIDEPFTLEIWATAIGVQNHSRVFDIGSSTSDFLMLNWSNGTDTGNVKFELRHAGTQNMANNILSGFGTGREYLITVTAAPNEEGNWVFNVYKRYASTGELRSSASFTAHRGWTPTHLKQAHFYLGHSQFTADNDANARYNEVRVWNRALTEEEQNESALLGPDTLPTFGSRVAKDDRLPFVKAGEGSLTLTGANAYFAPTRVAAGSLVLGMDASLPEGGDMTVHAEATLDLAGKNATFGALAGEGKVLRGGTLVAEDAICPGTDGYGTLEVEASALYGTLRVAGDDTGHCTKLVVTTPDPTAPFDLANLSFEVEDTSVLSPSVVYTVLEAPHGLTGAFSSTNLAGTHWNLTIDASSVKLRKPGFAVIMR